jgi:hypothetical protein
MKLHKCKVFKVTLCLTTSKKYNQYDFYKIKIYHNNIKQYFYIRHYCETFNNVPFSTFYKSINHQPFYPDLDCTHICNLSLNNHLIPPKREIKQEFYKYIELYPDIIKLFESKDEYSVRIGLEILKQQLELKIQ